MKDNNQSETFKKYQRTAIAEMRHVTESDILFMAKDMRQSTVQYPISISAADKENGSPKMGDMIARNPENHSDQWLVAQQYFKDNFGEMQPAPIVIEGKDVRFDIPKKYENVFALIDAEIDSLESTYENSNGGIGLPEILFDRLCEFKEFKSIDFAASTSNALLLEKAMQYIEKTKCYGNAESFQDATDLLNQYNESLKQTK